MLFAKAIIIHKLGFVCSDQHYYKVAKSSALTSLFYESKAYVQQAHNVKLLVCYCPSRILFT